MDSPEQTQTDLLRNYCHQCRPFYTSDEAYRVAFKSHKELIEFHREKCDKGCEGAERMERIIAGINKLINENPEFMQKCDKVVAMARK